MSDVYFDAVLDFNMKPLFNGTPDETKEWLKKQTPVLLDKVRVCDGYSMKMLTVKEYLGR